MGSAARTEVRWGLAPQTSGNANAAVTTMTHPIYTLNDPAILPGGSVIETSPLYSERSHQDEHTHVGRTNPTISGLEMPFNAYNCQHILASLFQGGTKATNTTTFNSAGIGWETIDHDDTASAFTAAPNLLTITRHFTATGDEDHYLCGAVCSSVTISGDVGGIITMSADFVGLGYGFDGDHTAASADANYALSYALNSFDSSADDIQIAGSSVTARSFSITLGNGARLGGWNSTSPQCIVFDPKMAVSGDMALRADMSDATYPAVQSLVSALTTPTDKLLAINRFTTSVGAAAEWSVESNMRMTGDPEVGEGDSAYDVSFPFKGVYKDSDNYDIEIKADNGTASWA